LNPNPIIRFAESEYVLGPDSAVSGPFRLANAPWMGEIANALADPRCKETTAQLAAQTGKNLLAELWTGYIISEAPGNILYYNSSNDAAKLFTRDRLFPRLQALPSIQPLWPRNKDGSLVTPIDELFLPHMYVLALGQNPTNLQGKSARYVLNDELHLWDAGNLDQARDRCSAFWDGKIFNISTAGEQGGEMDLAFSGGTQESWHLSCPTCGGLVRMRWATKPRAIVWESSDVTRPGGKSWNWQELRKTIRFVCPHEGCNEQFVDSRANRIAMNERAAYVALNPTAPPDKRSFHVPQAAAYWVPFEEIVERWIKAMEQFKTGDVSLLRNFVIKRLAETWEHQTPGGNHAKVTGGYSLSDVFNWPEESQRFMLVDVQAKGGRHFWVVVRAFSADGRSRLIWAVRASSWADVHALEKEHKVLAARVGVDCRHSPKEVEEACATYGWTWMEADEKARKYAHRDPATGIVYYRPFSMPSARDPGIGTKMQGRRIAYGMRFSKEWVRTAIHARIMGHGTEWGLPDDVSELRWPGTNDKETSYLEQINSWMPAEEQDKKTGRARRFWKQIKRDDHLRACEEMALIFAAVQGLIPNEIDEREGEELPEG
jgi:hypothetical protein